MNKKEYIDRALMHISNNRQKAKIRLELEQRIDERIKYNTDLGYDENTAVEKAISSMGLPDDTGRELNKMYKSKLYVPVIVIIMFLYALFCYCFSTMCLFAYEQTDFDTLWLVIESVLLVLNFVSLFFARRYSSVILSIIPTVFFGVFLYAIIFDYFISHIITVVCSIVVGKFGDFVKLAARYHVNITDGRAKVISIILITALIVLSVLVLYNAIRCKFNKYSIADTKIKNISGKVIPIFLVLTILLSAVTAFCIYKETFTRYSGAESASADGIYIVESDKKINPSEIELTDDNYIMIDYDWGNDYVEYNTENKKILETDYVTKYVKHNEYASYRTHTITAKYDASKKYVMVIPVVHDYSCAENKPVFDDAVWYKTDSDKKLQIEGIICNSIYYQVEVV